MDTDNRHDRFLRRIVLGVLCTAMAALLLLGGLDIRAAWTSPSEEAAYSAAHGIAAATDGSEFWKNGIMLVAAGDAYAPGTITYTPPQWQGYPLAAGAVKPATMCPVCGYENAPPEPERLPNGTILVSYQWWIVCGRCGVLYIPREITAATPEPNGPVSRSRETAPQNATREWR